MQCKIQKTRINGFTLIEVLLVIAILAILSAITIIAINPAKQLATARDNHRSADVYAILNAVHQYAIDHDGALPGGITTDNLEICMTYSSTCDSTYLYDLSDLTNNQKYLVELPIDPKCMTASGGCAENSTGYFINKTEGGRITVAAPSAEVTELISVTR